MWPNVPTIMRWNRCFLHMFVLVSCLDYSESQLLQTLNVWYIYLHWIIFYGKCIWVCISLYMSYIECLGTCKPVSLVPHDFSPTKEQQQEACGFHGLKRLGWEGKCDRRVTGSFIRGHPVIARGERLRVARVFLYFPSKWGAVQNARILKITGYM